MFIPIFQEIAISANNFVKVRELEESRDIIILHGGVGGYQRFTVSFANVIITVTFRVQSLLHI